MFPAAGSAPVPVISSTSTMTEEAEHSKMTKAAVILSVVSFVTSITAIAFIAHANRRVFTPSTVISAYTGTENPMTELAATKT